MIFSWGIRNILVGSMIVIVSWAIKNDLVNLRSILVGDMIRIVPWAIENNLVYYWGYSGWVYDCHSFLVISTGWAVIMIVSLAIWEITLFERY